MAAGAELGGAPLARVVTCPGPAALAARTVPAGGAGARDLVVGPWGARFRGRRLPCAIGSGGLTHGKREGDGATPRGVMRIIGLLWRPDRMARPAHWARPIGPRDLWCDDPGHPAYNHAARAPLAASHEALRRADRLYDAVLLTDWNWPDAEPGRGSAIFVHLWRKPRHPTAGCVAFARADLLWLLRHLRPGARLIVAPGATGASAGRD